ncbi:hypothetical protein [uncultured Tyzzerella sp.]|nr:hypothetical protein [uncultured Tyzzerella sp.]
MSAFVPIVISLSSPMAISTVSIAAMSVISRIDLEVRINAGI